MTTRTITQIKSDIQDIESRLGNFPREVTLLSPKLAILQKELIATLEEELVILSRGFLTLEEAKERAELVKEISEGVYQYTYNNQRIKIDNGIIVNIDW